MGRGHSHGRRGALALSRRRGTLRTHAAPSSAQNPWADPELPDTHEDLRDLVHRETLAHLKTWAAEQLSLTLEVNGTSGLPPHYARPHERLYYAPFIAAGALHAADIDDPQVRSILRDILALQHQHLKAFNAAMKGPGSQWTNDIARFYGLDARPASKRRFERDEILQHLREFSTQIEQFINGHRGPAHVLRAPAGVAHKVAQRSVLQNVAKRMLIAGDRYDLLAQLIDSFASPADPGKMLPWSQLELNDFTNDARMHQVLGSEQPWLHYLTTDKARNSAISRRAKAMKEMRSTGAPLFETRTSTAGLRTKANADDAVLLAHALLREPIRFGAGDPYRRPDGLRANVLVTEEAFGELAERFRAAPTWAGIEAFTFDRSGFERSAMGDLQRPQSRHVTVGAAAMLHANISGRDVTVRFMLPIDETTTRTAQNHSDIVKERLERTFGSDVTLNENGGGASLATAWNKMAIERDDTHVKEGRTALTDSNALLGPDRCRHEGGIWKEVPPYSRTVPNLPTYMQLSCSTCLRERIALAPLHKYTHHLELEHEVAGQYIRGYRAQAAYFGEQIPEDITMEQLRERDSHISLNPSDYANTPQSTPSASASLRSRVRPGALGRRRPHL